MKRSEMYLLRSAVVLVSDQNYLQHTHSSLVNCKRQGKWMEDFVLVLPPDIDIEYYTRRGIFVLTDPAPTYYKKFAIFDQYFRQTYQTEWDTPEYRWDSLIYLDQDTLVQAPLEPLLHVAGWNKILADQEMFTIGHAFLNWAPPDFLYDPIWTHLMQWLESEYDLNSPQYTTSVMVWHPRAISKGSRQYLADLTAKLAPVNKHVGKGTEQPIINLAFQGMFEHARNDLCCYYRNAWDGTIVVHYCSGFAPWIEKTPKMGGYFNDKLGRPCHEIYLENLAAFEKEFPLL